MHCSQRGDVNAHLASVWAEAAREAESSIDLSRFPLRLQVHMRLGHVGVTIAVQMRAEDRDAPGKQTRFEAEDGVSHHELERMAYSFLDFGKAKEAGEARKKALVERTLLVVRSIVLHELDECTLVDGERIYDPHIPERRRHDAHP